TSLKEKNIPGNSFAVKTGVITKCEGNNYIIDDLYNFNTDKQTFAVESRVSYDCFSCNGKENVVNVQLLENDWDIVPNSDALWNTRIIICKVDQRVNRNLILSPGNINVDLDNVSIEFLPVVGDWLELDVKCSINEKSVDLSGQIIEINKISPVRAHIEQGTITKWDSTTKDGIINKNIYFNKYSLSHGYIPVNGDKVIVESIESDQNRCPWRALKIIPETIAKYRTNLNKLNLTATEVKENHPGLCIETPVLSFSKLNENCNFFVTISNECKNNLILKEADFLNNSQCKILAKLDLPKDVVKDMPLKISCECTSRNVGSSNEVLLLSFEGFTITKCINITVTLQYNASVNNYERKTRTLLQNSSGNELIRGQRVAAPPRFIATQTPYYIVPQKLLDTMSKDFGDAMMLTEELKIDKFHGLLHLDEIMNLIMIRNYDMDKTSFIANDEFLMLEIENLSERRPSIVLGDKIIATDPFSRSGVDFEGFVHKVGARHIYMKFSPLFHDKYNGEDYSVKVIPSRSSYRRLHHAVHLAVRNLGKEILFPTRVIVKDPQQVNNADEDKKKSRNPSHVLNRLIQLNKSNSEIKNSDISPEDTSPKKKVGSELKLEWYNNRLNSKQKDAVVNVLLGIARPLPYIVFGPPGTGKTVTIIELVLQIVRLIPHSRLLITAPSNSASDLIALRLIESGVLKPGDLVRLVSHNYAVSDSIPVILVPYCATGSLAKDGTDDRDMPQSGIQYDRSRAALGRHRITVSTCSTAGQLYSMGFPKGHFSHIIVDQAAQASEPEVLIPLAFLDKSSGQVILAGDPMQLGPVVLSKIAAECGLSESYLQRLCNTFPYSRDPEGFLNNSGYDPKLVTKLLYNYRSLPAILKLCSSLFYDDELIATVDPETSREAMLNLKLKNILPKNESNKVPCVVFHGVNGVNYQNMDSPSWYNPHEAAQVFYYVNEFYRMGLSNKQIGIITPYIKQVKEIRSLLVEAEFDIPKIGTVEEFQGQEYDK
ncbi:hypothetical protein NQ318_016939, partial [Aromia moschata]